MIVIKELQVLFFIFFIQVACQVPYFIALLLYDLFIGLFFNI